MQQTNTIQAGAHSHRAAYLLLASVVILWGSNWPVMKIGLVEIPPFWFAGLGRVARQRLVYGLLAEEMQGRVHALALRTLTPEEDGR